MAPVGGQRKGQQNFWELPQHPACMALYQNLDCKAADGLHAWQCRGDRDKVSGQHSLRGRVRA